MNSDTGHIIDTKGLNEEELAALKEQGYDPVPDDLKRAAQSVLKGKKEGKVSLTSGGKLSRYAAKLRKLRYTRNRRRKIAKASRRKNRQRGK